MAETIFLRKVLGSLRPVDAHGEDAVSAIGPNEVVKAEITRPRNLRHHRKFQALLDVIFPHQDTYPTRKSFLAGVKCALGFGEVVKLKDGRTILVPGSISFANMDQADFEKFYARALDLIEGRILPGINRSDVDREVAEIIEGRRAA